MACTFVNRVSHMQKKKSGALNNSIDQRSHYIEYKKYKECKTLLRDERHKI